MIRWLKGWSITIVAIVLIFMTYILAGKTLALATAIVLVGVGVFDGVTYLVTGKTLSTHAGMLYKRKPAAFATWIIILMIGLAFLFFHFIAIGME